MSTSKEPADSVVWDSARQRYRWTAVLRHRTETGWADTESDARRLIRDWHTTELPPRFVGPRSLRAGIEPPRAP